MKRLLLAAAALLALAALAGVVGRPKEPAQRIRATDRTVTVTGVGAVRSVPTGPSSRSACRAAPPPRRPRSRRTRTAMRSACSPRSRRRGVSELQTQTVSVWPNWGDEGRLDGYVATNTVGGVVAVGRAGGAAIDAAVAAGANQVYGPTLTSDDARKLYDQALDAAVDDAEARARILAAAAGATLGRCLTIAESSAPPAAADGEGSGDRRVHPDRPRPAGDDRERHRDVRARVAGRAWGPPASDPHSPFRTTASARGRRGLATGRGACAWREPRGGRACPCRSRPGTGM